MPALEAKPKQKKEEKKRKNQTFPPFWARGK